MIELITFIVGAVVGVGAIFAYQLTKRGKKAYFTNQLKMAEQELWNNEFAKFSTMVAYEKQRALYSQGEDHLAQMKAKLENDKKNENLAKQVEQVETRLKNLKQGLDEYEMLLNGAPASEQYPDGLRGLNEKSEGVAQKKQNIQDFITYNC